MPQPKGKPLTAKQEAALAKGRYKKGDVGNPNGSSALARARAKIARRVAEDGDELYDAMFEAATRKGDIAAAKALVGALLPANRQEVEHTGDMTFGWSAGEEKLEPDHKGNGHDVHPEDDRRDDDHVQ